MTILFVYSLDESLIQGHWLRDQFPATPAAYHCPCLGVTESKTFQAATRLILTSTMLVLLGLRILPHAGGLHDPFARNGVLIGVIG